MKMMTLAEVLPMLRNGATVDDVFKIAENKAAPAEAERQTSNVVSFAEVKARRSALRKPSERPPKSAPDPC